MFARNSDLRSNNLNNNLSNNVTFDISPAFVILFVAQLTSPPVMWREDLLPKFCVLQRVHLSCFVYILKTDLFIHLPLFQRFYVG